MESWAATRLGPCEIQEPVWAKMSSALTAGVTKKRKKSDTKPQAQINKCQNEKRRREQENIYIEELAELISASFADMSSISVKPDKCAILQETVNQIRSIKQREIATQSSDPVQQGEVSSSERRPPILSNEIYGPLLLEALEGFLFVVNGEGKVEHVTDNVSTYIKFTREEVHGKCIYNFIHHGDHARFSATLLPMSIGWASEPTNKSRSFSCRLLIKPDDQDESMEEKQQRVSQYELMYISSTPLRQITEEDASDGGPCLLCVASRITHRDKVASSAAIEQFTTKLDIHWKIIGVDSSGISFQYSQFLNKDLVGKELEDICYQQDLPKLQQHLKETITEGQSTSSLYRLRIGHDKFVQVQTKSKLFKSHSSTDSEFVMATHSIISDNDCTGPSDPGGGSSVGGPLMTSVVNGTRNGAPVSSGSDSSTTSSSNLMNANASMFSTFTLDHHDQLQFGLDFPSSTWDLNTLDSPNWTEQRPDSRQSVTPVSTPTPRPPSAPVYSPATTIAQSPLAQFAQPSPTVPNPSTPYSSTYVFSAMTEPSFSMETDPQQQQHQQQQQQQQQQQKPDTKVNVLDDMSDSARLRTLLTKPPNNDNGDSENRNNNTILKTLLNQTDEDENRGDNRGSPRTHPATRNSLPGTSELPKPSAAGGMLLQLLNEKSDDDDVETRAGLKKGSELLHVLMKDDEKVPNKADTLLQSLGFNNNSAPPNGDPGRAKKRSSDDGDDNPLKRSSDGSHVTSSGSTGSKLCEKNKMLARLLAKTPSNHQPIPPIPASVISATPQEKLPRIDANLNKNHHRMQPNVNMMNSGRNSSRMQGRPTNTNYLNIMLASESNVQQRNPSRQYNHVDSTYASPATSSTDTAPSPMWPRMHPTSSDPLLSIILDQVIDIVPDAVMTNQNDIQTLLDAMSPQNNANNYTQNEAISETMAINIIQKSLMQCETAVKSPSSPTITMPGSSPAYTTNTMSQPNHGYQPPPNYTHMGTMNRPALRPGTPQYNLTNQQLLQRKQQMQQQEKRRLLERQSRQQVVIPSNAAADMNPSLDNIESLLNNTVAPNVSLQRSSSVPESQLSPNYQLSQQNARINNQQPYSPHSQMSSPIGQQTGNYQQGGSSISPRPPFNQQLSPRQAYPQTSSQNANWQPGRLSVQQQQNPMLNAQLTGNYVIGPNGRGFPVQRGAPQQQQSQQQQQPRAIGSPGSAAGTRQSPFPADSFPPPASPNSGYSQSQYLRLQRNNSAPSATTQLPGGLGSPRPFARDHPTHSYPSIPPNPHHPMMYQQESSPYCYDQTGLQLPYNGADRGTRAPPHLQAGVPGGNGPASDYVRQELRAVVGARTGQQIPTGNTTRPQTQQQQQQQQQQLLNQNVNNSDLEALGLSFETSGASESPKLWVAMGSDMGSMSPPQAATSRNTMEEGRQGDHKSSLLQKLLSE